MNSTYSERHEDVNTNGTIKVEIGGRAFSVTLEEFIKLCQDRVRLRVLGPVESAGTNE